jgi:hypothetical protein
MVFACVPCSRDGSTYELEALKVVLSQNSVFPSSRCTYRLWDPPSGYHELFPGGGGGG